MALDNMLSRSRILDASNQEPDTVALRRMNEFIHRDERVDALLLPMGDGLTLAVKR
jgi:predicted O-methyltransferase YrrM